MKKSLLASVGLITIFFLVSSFKIVSDNYFEIGSKKWNLTSARIVNESYGLYSKFELNLFDDRTYSSEDKTVIAFSLTSSNTRKVEDGIYEFSSSPLMERAPYSFNGVIIIDGDEFRITKGSFSLETLKDSIAVHLILKLSNGNVVNGTYKGKVSFADRRQGMSFR